MDDEFRVPLERRIGTLRGLREGLQEQLRELHHELNSVDRRIDAAEDMYRQEFGTEPPAVAPTTHRRRASRIRRSETDQPPWRDAVIDVLRREARPLHAREIWQRLRDSGFETAAVDPLRSVVAVAIRSQDQIRRVGPNTFALNGVDPEPTLLDDDGRPTPLEQEGEGT